MCKSTVTAFFFTSELLHTCVQNDYEFEIRIDFQSTFVTSAVNPMTEENGEAGRRDDDPLQEVGGSDDAVECNSEGEAGGAAGGEDRDPLRGRDKPADDDRSEGEAAAAGEDVSRCLPSRHQTARLRRSCGTSRLRACGTSCAPRHLLPACGRSCDVARGRPRAEARRRWCAARLITSPRQAVHRVPRSVLVGGGAVGLRARNTSVFAARTRASTRSSTLPACADVMGNLWLGTFQPAGFQLPLPTAQACPQPSSLSTQLALSL